ncbi:glycosyltransferase, partial [uncultured Desulfovibrio sp.]
FKKYGVTVGLVPSVWPETFCYVVQECMQLGLPLVAFNLGAQGERVGKWEHGLLADEISAAGAYKALLALDARRMVARHPEPMQEAGTA